MKNGSAFWPSTMWPGFNMKNREMKQRGLRKKVKGNLWNRDFYERNIGGSDIGVGIIIGLFTWKLHCIWVLLMVFFLVFLN